MVFDDDVEILIAQIEAAPGYQRLRELDDTPGLDKEFVGAALSEALRFSRTRLVALDTEADRKGCRLEQGRVVLAPGHQAVWHEFRDGGWAGLDIEAQFGGMGLPRISATAIQECFDRGSVSFGMAPGAARAAARLLRAHANRAITELWIPKLACGEWGATICISEADAGSDVGRIRTAARRDPSGAWRITGEKMWISYADHDLTESIGHIVLARPEGGGPGARGLSVFLVASQIAAPDGQQVRNRIAVRRIEDKLGLHGSPTCVLEFDGAQAELIGSEGRGVAQLFSMIVAMRLQVGTQGLGLAEASFRAAAAYSRERRQGGAWNAPPVPIIAHADVQLTLMGMASRIATLRGLVYAGAIAADLSDIATDAEERSGAAVLQAWLLPIIKNSGAETAFTVAADAILIFGGAGYTTEWPVERYLRDARVLAIYEGTAGMQALDLVRRRWREPGTGFEAFCAVVSADMGRLSPMLHEPLRDALRALQEVTVWLREAARQDWEIEAAARAALTLATETAHGWMGARLAALQATTGATQRLAACGRHALSVMRERIPSALIALREATIRKLNYADSGLGRSDE